MGRSNVKSNDISYHRTLFWLWNNTSSQMKRLTTGFSKFTSLVLKLLSLGMQVSTIWFNSYRYASLYFCCAMEQEDNELLTLELIHRYVELLDKYFGSVSVFFIFFQYIGHQLKTIAHQFEMLQRYKAMFLYILFLYLKLKCRKTLHLNKRQVF